MQPDSRQQLPQQKHLDPCHTIASVQIELKPCWKIGVADTHRIHWINTCRHGPSFAATSSATPVKRRTHTGFRCGAHRLNRLILHWRSCRHTTCNTSSSFAGPLIETLDGQHTMRAPEHMVLTDGHAQTGHLRFFQPALVITGTPTCGYSIC